MSKWFHDKRQISFLFAIWGGFVLCMFWYCGIFHSDFVHLGPSHRVKFLNFPIDTWSKWWMVAIFCMIDSAMWELAQKAIHPWEMNTVLDPKTEFLPYSKTTCLLVLESYYLHGVIIGPFEIWMSLTQFDFALIKGGSRMLMRLYSHYQYIKHKSTGHMKQVIDVCV